MFAKEFDKLPVHDDLQEEIDKNKIPLQKGDYFLTPTLSDMQKGQKNKHDEVTVYKVIEVRANGNIVFKPEYIRLEG